MAKDKAKSNGSGATAEERLTEANVKAIADIEEAAKKDRTISETLAEAVAGFAGSMSFVWLNVVWFGSWITFNTILESGFDPFPFTFLTLMVSLEAILLSIFILINQNRETQIMQRRNHLDLQVNLLSEQENTKMLYLLESIAEKVGVETDDKRFQEGLDEITDPAKLMEQITSETE